MTFSELAKTWKQRRLNELSYNVARCMLPMLQRWLRHFGQMEISEITPAHIEAYRLTRDNGQRKGGALNRERTQLRNFFQLAIDLGEIESSPMGSWRRRREVVSRTYVTLSKEEEDRLCAELSRALERYVRFSTATGLRQGTIRQIRRGWVNVERRTVTIPAGSEKSRKTTTIPLSQKAWEQLDWDSEFLIPLPSQSVIHKAIRAAAGRAGLPSSLTPHDLRRTWVERMRDGGASMFDVMVLGGWSNPSAMIKHYFLSVPSKKGMEVLHAL